MLARAYIACRSPKIGGNALVMCWMCWWLCEGAVIWATHIIVLVGRSVVLEKVCVGGVQLWSNQDLTNDLFFGGCKLLTTSLGF